MTGLRDSSREIRAGRQQQPSAGETVYRRRAPGRRPRQLQVRVGSSRDRRQHAPTLVHRVGSSAVLTFVGLYALVAIVVYLT